MFAVQEKNIYTTSSHAGLIQKEIPAGTYTVKSSMETGFFLSKIDDFNLPEKIYGSTNNRAERVINTFFERPRSTGVILRGEKGSGKTLLTTAIAKRMVEEYKIPVIVVENGYTGTGFLSFIDSFEQDIVVLFDEFDKIYPNEENQNTLLSLLDGIYQKRRMWILTSNSYNLSPFLLDRPGRIFYNWKYKTLEKDVVFEYLADKLVNKVHTEAAKTFILGSKMNFDCMKAVVEEMNRYNLAVYDAAEGLNVPEFNPLKFIYNVEVLYKGEKLQENKDLTGVIGGFSFAISQELEEAVLPDDEETFDKDYFRISPDSIKSYNAETGEIYAEESLSVVKTNDDDTELRKETFVIHMVPSIPEKVRGQFW